MTVGNLHQALLEAGCAIDKGELERGEDGPSTRVAVETFQRAHGLAVDGICGPKTWLELKGGNKRERERYTAPGWRCYPSEARAEVRPVLIAAVGEIGVCEDPPGSNRGPRVDQYGGGTSGTAWCAHFVSWCFAYAEGGSPFGHVASVYKLGLWAAGAKRLLRPGEIVSPGDLWCALRSDYHGHVEIVGGGTPDALSCIGGNSRSAVRGNVRRAADATIIVRPIP